MKQARSKEFLSRSYEEGLLLVSANGESTLRFAPSLIISDEEIEEGFSKTRKSYQIFLLVLWNALGPVDFSEAFREKISLLPLAPTKLFKSFDFISKCCLPLNIFKESFSPRALAKITLSSSEA